MKYPKKVWIYIEKSINNEKIIWCQTSSIPDGKEYVRKDLYDALKRKLERAESDSTQN